MPPTRNREDEEIFYSELDKKSVKRSCCVWQTFIIFFVVLTLAAVGLTIYVFYKIKSSDFSIEKVYPNFASRDAFVNKLKIDQSKNPTFTITITEQDLNSILSSGLKTLAFEIKDIQSEIIPEGINFLGRLTKPLKANIKVEAKPEVFEGKIVLKVDKVTAGTLGLPGFLNKDIEKALNILIDENFASLYKNYKVTNLLLNQTQLQITGELKKETE